MIWEHNHKRMLGRIPPALLERILKDRRVRIELTRQCLFHFLCIYLDKYLKYQFAPFHHEMIRIVEDQRIKRAVIAAFRDSAKSTILNTAYALWSIVGVPQKKHVVIGSNTQGQARLHLKNIRVEIEGNGLLRSHLGPFQEGEDEWRSSALIIPRYGARITAVSVEEGIRGLRYGPHRPDLFIMDDIEDSSTVKTKEGRDKVFNWLTGELFPSGTPDVKAVILGNMLHLDSVIMRLEELIKGGEMPGEFLKVPLLDKEGNIAWLGKFASMEAVESQRKYIGSDILWNREYLLKVITDSHPVVLPEEIHYYDEIPKSEFYHGDDSQSILKGITGTGVDLAISQGGDYTAMVSGELIYIDDVPKIYIKPHPINDHLDFHQTIETAKAIHKVSGGFHQFFVEDSGYQKAAIQEMQRSELPVIPMSTRGDKKRARFEVAAMHIKNKTVLFPRKGCESLTNQLIYFGSEAHDDLVDAIVYLILGMVNHGGLALQGVIPLL